MQRPGTGRSVCLRREGKRNAVTSNTAGSRSNRCPALAGQQLHTHAGHDQVDLECCRSDLHRSMASQYFRVVSFAVPPARWDVSESDNAGAKKRTNYVNGGNTHEGTWNH